MQKLFEITEKCSNISSLRDAPLSRPFSVSALSSKIRSFRCIVRSIIEYIFSYWAKMYGGPCIPLNKPSKTSYHCIMEPSHESLCNFSHVYTWLKKCKCVHIYIYVLCQINHGFLYKWIGR